MRVNGVKCFRLIATLACVTACGASPRAQSEQHTVSGQVVVSGAGGVAGIPVAIEAGDERVIRTKSKKDGRYSISFPADKRPLNVIYGNDRYLPNMVNSISGESSHTITKVLIPNENSAVLSTTEGSAVVATLEHMRSHPKAFGDEWVSISLSIKSSIFPAEMQARIGDLRLAAANAPTMKRRVLPGMEFATLTPEEYNKNPARYNEALRRYGMTSADPKDRWLLISIIRSVAARGVPLESAKLDVKGGVVTMRGSVSTPSEKTRLEELVQGVEGVRGVRNKIKTSAPQIFPEGTYAVVSREEYEWRKDVYDSEIRRFGYDPGIDPDDGWILINIIGRFYRNQEVLRSMKVEVSGGFVTLRGQVASLAEKAQIEQTVRRVQGVKMVRNLLALPTWK